MLWLTKLFENGNVARVDQFPLLFVSFLLAGVLLADEGSAAEPPITAIAFDPDGGQLLVASQSGVNVRTWPKLDTERELDTAVENVRDLRFDSTGKWLAIAGGRPTEEGTVEILEWPSGQSTQIRSDHDDVVTSVAWTDNGMLIAGGMDHDLFVFERSTKNGVKPQRLRGHSKGVLSVVTLPGSDWMVSAGIDQNLRVWNTESLELIRSLNNHTKTVTDMAAKPGPLPLPVVASASEDKTIRLWQPSIGRMIRFARLDSVPLQVGWYPDGSLIVASCADGGIRVVDPTTAQVVEKLDGIDGWAYALAVHPTDGSIAVGGLNGHLKRVVLPIASER